MNFGAKKIINNLIDVTSNNVSFPKTFDTLKLIQIDKTRSHVKVS